MRIKRGTTKNRKHKKVLKSTKGYRLSYSISIKRAKEAALHAGQYSFAHRRKRGNDFRRLWIKRINAALSQFDMKYSSFMSSLKKANITLNRKVLADLALDHPEEFKAVVEAVK
jgi:large subunit ribosomal protein L20